MSARRRVSWHGRVPARALWFSPALDDVAGRVIAAWAPSARLYVLDGGVLLVLPRDVRLDARVADGEVFVDVDGVLSSLPLLPAERALEHGFARGSVVRARGGIVAAARLAALDSLDGAALVDTRAIEVVDVEPLAAPPVLAVVAPPPGVDARASLLGDSAPNPERDAAAAALRAATLDEQAAGAGAPVPDNALRRAQERAARGVPAAGVGESLLRVVVRALESTGLLERLRRVHREYLEDTLERLKRGDLDDALRRAVPLARPGEPAGLRSPALTVPRPRADLRIGVRPRPGAGGAITVEDDLLTRLRRSYREAARKLEKEGRFKEAAFVFIELLGEVHEALALLERSRDRELLRLAAELAESYALPPGVVVRQWMIAGDVAHAVAAARRLRAFSDAVTALERTSHVSEARALRRAWALHLASTGAHADAVDVVAVANERELVLQLLDRGIAAGGADVPRLVGRRLLVDAEKAADFERAPPRDLGRLQAILDDDGPDGPHRRAQLAFALGAPPAPLRPAMSALVRALFSDVAAGAAPLNLRVLAERSDASLRADLPPLPSLPPARHPSYVLVLDGPPGRSVARAVALLPEGRLLVGLGESGAACVTRRGGAAWRTGEPCDDVVLADRGDRAVLVARRGSFMRLARADVASGAVRPFTDVRADHVAASTDGDLLLVTRDLDLLGLDALADAPRILWQARLPGPAFALARDEQGVAVLHDGPDGLRVALFDARTLALREERPAPVDVLPLLGLSPAGELLAVDADPFANLALSVPLDAFPLNPPHGRRPTPPLAVARGIAALPFRRGGAEPGAGLVVRARPHPRLVVELRDAVPTALFVRDTTLVVCDDRGRAFVVDAARGVLLQSVALP